MSAAVALASANLVRINLSLRHFTLELQGNQYLLCTLLGVSFRILKVCLSNYRPISSLSVFNKILERLMYNRLISFLDKKNLVFDLVTVQNHAVLCIVDKIQRAINN